MAHLARLVSLHEDVATLLDLASLTRVPDGRASVTGVVRDHIVIVGHLQMQNRPCVRRPFLLVDRVDKGHGADRIRREQQWQVQTARRVRVGYGEECHAIGRVDGGTFGRCLRTRVGTQTL